MRWLPLIALLTSAILFEPLRSDFTLMVQSCEFIGTSAQVAAAFGNMRHLIGYGLICAAAVFAMGTRRLSWAVGGTFVFSILMELEQTRFVTGHCRAWDLIPNGIAVVAVGGLVWFIRRSRQLAGKSGDPRDGARG